jgi:hypothetical protein
MKRVVAFVELLLSSLVNRANQKPSNAVPTWFLARCCRINIVLALLKRQTKLPGKNIHIIPAISAVFA